MKRGRYLRWHLRLVVGFLIVAALACTLPWPRREAGPNVVIDSPTSGTTVQVGQEVTIQSTSTDARGVSKVELWVDEALVHTDSSPVARGQTPFSVLQSWTPLSPGEYTIVVKAYNVTGQVGESEAITLSAVEVIGEASPTPSLEVTETPTLVVASPTPTSIPTPTSTSTPTGITPTPTDTATPTSTPTATPPAGPCLTSVTTVSVGTHPKGVAAGANRVYVGLHDAPQVKVIDRASNTVVGTWDTGATVGPRYANGVVLTRRHVYVANRDEGSVSVINIDDPTDVKIVSVGSKPFGVAAGTDYVFVANFNSHNVTVIDSRTISAVGTVSVGRYPTMLTAIGNTAYVATWEDGVYKVEGAALSATQIAPPRKGYFGVIANTATGQVFVTNVLAKDIIVINSATDSVVTTIAIEPPYALHGLAVNPRNGYLYAASADADAIYVFDGLEKIGTLELSAQNDDEGGQGITVYGDRLYMTFYDQGELGVWDDSACD
ncbi:MAG: Ig-like domain-containing protein [Anaerolineae bacterium]